VPAESKAQRIAMAIAEHHPEKLNPENKGLADMTHKQLHDFASTPEKGLPQHVHHSQTPYHLAHAARKRG
jgi:hypothetical protein